MLHSLRKSLSTGRSLTRIPRCALSVGNESNSSADVAYSRHLDMGRQAFRVYAVQKLNERTDLSVAEVRDVVTGLTYPNQLLPTEVEHRSDNPVDDLMAEIGRLKMCGDEGYSDILNNVNDTCLATLTPENTDTLVKLSHPKFVLKHLCDAEGVEFNTHIVQCGETGRHIVTVSLADGTQYTSEHECLEEATHLACLETVQNTFPDQLAQMQLPGSHEEITLEQDVNINDRDAIRKVSACTLLWIITITISTATSHVLL